jgi:GNAT superfamily N-acetyltransferase
MHAIAYRLAAPEDIETMAELRSASGWAGGAGVDTMRRYLAGEHHPQQALAPRAVIVAEAEGTLVGFIAGHRTTRFGCAGELQWLLAAPAYRGGRIASALIAALATWFAGEGVTRVCVNVAPDNVPARRLYARHGAVTLSEYWMMWPDIAVAGPSESGASHQVGG